MSRLGQRAEVDVAVALDYEDGGSAAPTVGAVGAGSLAEEMKRIALRYGVPIERNSKLAFRLSAVEHDQEIPPRFYGEVVEILLRR